MGVYSETYYRSNALGMILKKIDPYTKNTYEWILKRKVENGIETRTLYHNNNEMSVTTRVENGSEIIVREFKKGILRKKEIFRDIYLLKEIHYDVSGKTETIINHWKNNQLFMSDHLKDGNLIYTNTYLIDIKGTLKRVVKISVDGSSQSTGFQFSNDRLLNEWNNGGNIYSIYRYGKGHIKKVETYDSQGIVSSQDINTDKENGKEVLITNRNGEKIMRQYDSKKRIIYESYTGTGPDRIIIYSYSGGKLSEKLIKEPGMREKHLYIYSQDDTVKKEKVYRDNDLLKEILPENNGKSEEIIYQDGKPVLKVFYKNNVFISREPYSNSE